VLFSSTLGNVLWGFLILSLLLPYLRRRGGAKAVAEESTG